MKNAFMAMLAALALAVAGAAQTNPPQEITITVGHGELLQFDNDIRTVAASEPKIADAVVVSPREVMINAKGAGRATVVIWEQNAQPRRYNIRVINDPTDFETFQKAIKEAVGDSEVKVQGNTETLVLTGTAKSVEVSKRAEALASTHARKVINLIQTPVPADPRQVLLQVKVASVDRIALSEVGFNLLSRNEKTLGVTGTQQFQGPRLSQLQFQDQSFSNTTINFADLLNLFVFRPDLNIGATIKALQARNLLEILAEPNLIAIEGKEASFLAGGEFPFPTLTATTTGGAVAPVITVQFKKFGVQLDFVPTVTHNQGINLKVRPEVSALDYTNAVTVQGYLIPAISARRAETEVLLKDGESFAIAGLIDSRVIQSINKIPWIGDVPILGHLFRSRSTKKTTDELLIVVTPRFVRPLSPDEQVKLPDLVEPFLPPASEDKGAGGKKKKGTAESSKAAPKPEYVGPRGYQDPQKKK